jgi:hypothetical protein
MFGGLNMGLKIITFIDCNGNIICKQKLTSLPLKEKCIIDKSIELFSDCEPCIIHRTFVMKKIFFEIDECLDKIVNEGKSEISVENISKNIMNYLDLKDTPSKICIS